MNPVGNTLATPVAPSQVQEGATGVASVLPTGFIIRSRQRPSKHPQRLVVSQFGSEPNGRRVHRLSGRRKGFLSNHRCRPRVINIVLSGDVGVFPKFSDFPPRHSASPALEVTLSNRLKFESLRPRPVPKRLDFPPFSRPH